MPIELYTGLQGAGKTFCMVKEAILPALRDPRWEVLSNLAVEHPHTKRHAINITDATGRRIDFQLLAHLINQNLNAPPSLRRNLLIAIDEIGAAMPQEMWRSEEVLDVISIVLQLRKGRCDFVGTTQHFERAVKILRDNTNVVHQCEVFKRTWLWWHRDETGPLNRKSGKPYKLVWLFEVESVPPTAIHLAPDSPARQKRRVGWRKVRFDWTTARAYDTYQRQAIATLTPTTLTGADDDQELLAAEAARNVIDLRISEGVLSDATGTTPPRRRTRRR